MELATIVPSVGFAADHAASSSIAQPDGAAKLKAQIRRAKARITNAERKRRTHRLVLLGTYLDHCMKTDPISKTQAMKGLDEFMERDRDRAVFDLPPRPKAD